MCSNYSDKLLARHGRAGNTGLVLLTLVVVVIIVLLIITARATGHAEHDANDQAQGGGAPSGVDANAKCHDNALDTLVNIDI